MPERLSQHKAAGFPGRTHPQFTPPIPQFHVPEATPVVSRTGMPRLQAKLTVNQAIEGVSDAIGGAASWLGGTAQEAATGLGSAAGSAAGWIGNTTSEGASGLAGAASGVANWGVDTAGAVGSLAASKIGDLLPW